MSATRPAALGAQESHEAVGAPSPAEVARAALRRLALEKLEPTPENYARAFRREAGDAMAASLLPSRAQRIVERLAMRLFDGAGAELGKQLSLAVGQARWDLAERVLDATEGEARPGPMTATDSGPQATGPAANDPQEASGAAVAPSADAVDAWRRVARDLARTLREALPNPDGSAHELVAELDQLEQRLDAEGATPSLAAEMQSACERAQRVLQHRHHLFDELGKLCRELTASMGDLSEDESWVRGQCDAMRVRIDEGLSARGVRAVSELLTQARQGQTQLKGEREKAREALRALMGEMIGEIGELGDRTGDFHQSVGRYAAEIESSDSIDDLAGVVRSMVEESRSVQALVQQTQSRLQAEHSKATELSARVTQLEDEMRRLSDEVSTDQLTQVANRRGLAQAFEMERSRHERGGGPLSIGLIDIDNFKKLNDRLGHGAGDEALKSLAAVTRKTLRPTDHVARFGGEEFVVLLPGTGIADAQSILARLQRSLSIGLFMHKDEKVLVTFSAGVTAYRQGETLESALERADQALYEAKRSGKNRTCAG
jgi:diguanylate cyclase